MSKVEQDDGYKPRPFNLDLYSQQSLISAIKLQELVKEKIKEVNEHIKSTEHGIKKNSKILNLSPKSAQLIR